MKTVIHHWSIGRRIALALALPMLAMLGLALWAGVSQYERATSQKHAREFAEFATGINTLVHSLQLERGTAIALLGSNEPALVEPLHARQQQTDLARNGFYALANRLTSRRLPPELTQHIARTVQAVEDVDVIRTELPQGADPSTTLINQYAAVVERMLHIAQEVLQSGNFEHELGRTLQTYTRVMQAKEYAGLERALGAAVFASNRFDPVKLLRLLELGERQSMLLDSGQLFTQQVDLSGPQGEWSAQDAQALTQMRQAAQLSLGSGKPGGISKERWFELTTQRIELMKAAEDRLGQAMIERANWAETVALRSAAWVGALTLSVLLLALWLAWKLAQDIIHPLRRITEAMRHLASRDDAVALVDENRDDEIGDMARALGVFRSNLTEVIAAQTRRQSDAVLRTKESYQRALLNNFPFEVWLKDTDGVFLAANKAVSDHLGLNSPDALVGKTDAELRAHADASRIRADDLEVMRLREPRVDEQEVPRMDSRGTYWIETWKAPVTDDQGALLGTVGFSRDITRDKLAQEENRQLALYDALTGIPNRRLLGDRLHFALGQARRDQVMLALVFIDLDQFKPVNDTLGHAVGDALLVDVSRRIQACLRETDTVARVGGDEFVVLLASVNHQHNALALAEKIRHSLNQPFDLPGGYRVQISSSSGVALYPEHGETEEELSENADKAMYQAKQTGRNRVCLYSPHVPASSPSASMTSPRPG